MLQAGGIDKLVEQKADAYRGNPQALQKRYSQNQELMDLLAMQKLKTEKESASREMALKAEQTPSTIAEQYEQQLVGMNKNEMAGQVAGVLGQKQKQSQQKQQAMGIPPQRPQGQRPPMPQSAPQGIASQPRPNMQGMAQGGIIGYVAGGEVSEKDIEEWLKNNPSVFPQATPARRRQEAIKQIGKAAPAKRAATSKSISVSAAEREAFRKANPNVFPQADDKKIDDIIQTEKYGKRDLQGRSSVPASKESAAAAAQKIKGIAGLEPSAIEQIAKANAPDPSTTGIGAPLVGAGTVLAAPAVQPPTGQAPAGQPPAGQPPVGQAPAGGAEVESMLGIVGLSTEDLNKTVDTSGIGQTQVTDRLKDNKVLSALQKSAKADPSKAQQDTITRMSGADKSKGGLDREGQEATYNKYLKEKEVLDTELLDPARLKRERANAGIRGLIEGGTGRGASIARGKFDENTIASRQASITQRLGIEQKRMDNDVKIATEINAEAGRAMGRVYQDRQSALGTLAKLPAEDIAAATQQAKLKIDQNHNEIKNKIDALQAISTAQLNKAAGMANNTAEIGRALSSLQEVRRKAKEDFYARISPQVSILRTKQANGTLTTDEADTLANFEVEVNQILEETGIDDSIDYFSNLLTGKPESGTAPDPDPRAASANKYIQP